MRLFLSYYTGTEPSHELRRIHLDSSYTWSWIAYLVECLIAGEDVVVLDATGTKHRLTASGLSSATVEE